MNIVLTSDNNYAQHVGVAIASILINNKTPINIYILDGGISAKNIVKIKKLNRLNTKSNINFIKINRNDFADCPVQTQYLSYIVESTYYRLKIASLLPHLDKALFLDSDLVNIDSLKELWDEDIKEFYAGVINDPNIQVVKQDKERLGVSNYFNAGVLLLNLKRWKDDNIEDKCFDFIKKYPEKIRWLDQDVLNSILNNNVKFLNPKYNSQAVFNLKKFKYNSLKENEDVKKPVIIHYNTSAKPWMRHSKNPNNKYYFKYLRKTPWAITHYANELLTTFNFFKFIIIVLTRRI